MVHNWVRMTPDSAIPQLAIIGGSASDGSLTYVGRSSHEGGTFPATVASNKQCAYISWTGDQIKKADYEILVGKKGNYRFVKCTGIPLCAVRAGNTADGEPMYVGRGIIKENQIVGKIHPIHQCLFVPFEGKEHRLYCYEVLVCESPESHIWIRSSLDNIPANAVVGGMEMINDKECPILIGRAYNSNETLPANVIPKKGLAWVVKVVAIPKYEFDVLVGDGYTWIEGAHSGESIPPGAVATGHTVNGELVYVGRTRFRGIMVPGKVHPDGYSIWIPFEGREYNITKDYEVLVRKY